MTANIAKAGRARLTRHSLSGRARGQALIEMVLVVTVLMTLAFGIIDFGVYMYKYVQAANCVREAARRAVVRADNAASPPYCVDAGLKPTVTAGYKTLKAGSEVTATINTTHSWLALHYVIPGIKNPIPLTAKTSMRTEGQIVPG